MFQNSSISLQKIILFVSVFLVTLNSIYLVIHVISKTAKHAPIYEPGYQFADFKEKLSGQSVVGYMTNRDNTPEKNDQEFLLAQFMLAPTRLDFNNADHPFLILDYTSPIFMKYALNEFNAKVIYDNKFNKVLAVKSP